MSAPGSVKLDEHVLVVVDDVLLIGVGDNDVDGAALVLGGGLRLDAGLDLASDVVLDVLANSLGRKLLVLVQGVLLVLDGVLDGKGGPLADLEVEVRAVLTKGLCVNGGEVDLALVLLGDGLELLGELLALLGSLGEDVGKRQTRLTWLASVLIRGQSELTVM